MDRKMKGRGKREMKGSANTMSNGMMRYVYNFFHCWHTNGQIFFPFFPSGSFANASSICYLQVTAEDMEAYRMKKVHHDDPMKDFLH